MAMVILTGVTPEQLKRIRARLQMTQVQLAAALGVRQETVARWEIGSRGIPEPTARLIELTAKGRKKASNSRSRSRGAK
jgi:DNA-binding transcriptional regulator YiaG